MIKIFLQNIIVVVFHLISVGTFATWHETTPLYKSVEYSVTAENWEYSSENLSNAISDMPKESWYSAGLFAHPQTEFRSEFIAGSYFFKKNGYRNNLKFYSSGVSPPAN